MFHAVYARFHFQDLPNLPDVAKDIGREGKVVGREGWRGYGGGRGGGGIARVARLSNCSGSVPATSFAFIVIHFHFALRAQIVALILPGNFLFSRPFSVPAVVTLCLEDGTK